MGEVPREGEAVTESRSDPRRDARGLDVIAAVQLALAGRDLTTDRRILDIIEWLVALERLEPNGTVPTRMFVRAIEETKGDRDA